MIELEIGEEQEKVRLASGTICRVLAIWENVHGTVFVDAISASGETVADLCIGENCEFTNEAMNYPENYAAMLI